MKQKDARKYRHALNLLERISRRSSVIQQNGILISLCNINLHVLRNPIFMSGSWRSMCLKMSRQNFKGNNGAEILGI